MAQQPEIAVGISITNQCYNCLMLDQVCPDCEDSRQAKDATIAHELVDEGNLQYPRAWAITQPEPSAHDWVSSITRLAKPARLQDGTIVEERYEFLDPTTALIDRLFELNVDMPPNSAVCSDCHYTYNMFAPCPNCN